MTDIDLDAIEAATAKATPGPWPEDIESIGTPGDVPSDRSYYCCGPYHPRGPASEINAKADAAYLALLDPTTVQELVRRARRLEELEKVLRETHESYCRPKCLFCIDASGNAAPPGNPAWKCPECDGTGRSTAWTARGLHAPECLLYEVDP